MIAILLALCAAALSALSAAGEQRAASRVARRHRTVAGRGPGRASAVLFALALVSTPLWLVSWTVDAGSFFVQATALHLGSLSVVQPLMVTTLLFSVPLAALGVGTRATARDWGGALAISAGLALLLGTRGLPADDAAPGPGLLPGMGALVLAAAALAVLARGRSPSVRALLFSAAAGGLFGVGAAATKLTAATAADSGFTGLLTSWPGYALAGVSVASFALQQAAYASGPLAPAVTAVVVVDPLASYALGVVGFGEPLPRPGFPLVASCVGAVVLVVGAATLARSPLLHAERETSARQAGGTAHAAPAVEAPSVDPQSKRPDDVAERRPEGVAVWRREVVVERGPDVLCAAAHCQQ